VTFEEAIDRLCRELEASSPLWSVETLKSSSNRWTVECRHPASHGLDIDVDPTNDAQVVSLTQGWSGRREFVIASSAPPLVHPERALSLRTLIDAFQWTAIEVRGLTFVLYEHGFLTLDETAWLAGYAAADAPRRPISPEGPAADKA
jgi:hypothetical protein